MIIILIICYQLLQMTLFNIQYLVQKGNQFSFYNNTIMQIILGITQLKVWPSKYYKRE